MLEKMKIELLKLPSIDTCPFSMLFTTYMEYISTRIDVD